ncbi:MAG: 23S rRNA (uracil(1939)-C(5))-methyltransferase RlmD [Clostridiales bacterium]|jgi:23S rRNA (uracil1939-C5)-methyltransferase|nr:23S rRNA (uracil(1939)-C(5))-methyltransferase RlmD [Clostridiales bacterium]
MKINDLAELEITAIGCNMEGIAKHGDIVTFVPYADVGERVSARIVHVSKSYAFAEECGILRASAYRRKPPCEHFGKCGGCDCQHLTYERQTEHKERILKDTLAKFFDISDITFLPIKHGENQLHYRNKLQMPISQGRDGAIIGFFEKDSHRAVDIDNCPLHGGWAETVIKCVRQYAEACRISAYDERSHKGILRHIVARNVCGHTSVLMVINARELPKYSALIDILEYSIQDFSLHISVNTKQTNVILGDNIKTLYGNPRAQCQAFGIKADISPLSFMQVNDEVRDIIYADVMSCVKSSEVIIDAYSGGGLLTALLARNADKVYGIEIVKEAVSDADRLMKDNGITNAENLLGDTAELLPPLIDKLKCESAQSITVVLDPPRKGCDKKVIDALLKAIPKGIVYVSCNPATLARDLAYLNARYDIKTVTPYDMFPNTRHIETLVSLSLRP